MRKEDWEKVVANDEVMELVLDVFLDCAPNEDAKNMIRLLQLCRAMNGEINRIVEAYDPTSGADPKSRERAVDFLESVLSALKNFPG